MDVVATYESELARVNAMARNGAGVDAEARRAGAATKIGAGTRGWQQRKLQTEQQEAARRIGASTRGWKQRKELRQQKEAATSIGAAVGSVLTTKD